MDPNLLGSLHDGEAFVIAQRRAHLVRVAKRSLPEHVLWRADEVLRPKVEEERLQARNVPTPDRSELRRAIDS